MSFGGFLGIGYRTDITEQHLRGAPAFSRDRDYDWSDRNRESSCIVVTALDPIGSSRQLVLSRPAHHRAALFVVIMSSYRYGERSVIAQEPERARRS
jgi:hypothetical protein